MVMEFGDYLNILQTAAIVITLLFTFWQWKKTVEATKMDNLSKIISSLNDLRCNRMQNPDLERALFESRKEMTDNQIRKRVYNVQFANIFEWVYLSYKKGLINAKEWQDWSTLWKNVILNDMSMKEMMLDETIYTFSLDSHKLIKQWINDNKGC